MRIIRNLTFYIFILLICSIQSCEEKTEVVPDEPEEEIDLTACLTSVTDDDFEIMTWNVKDFPVNGDQTLELLSYIINVQEPDIIAFQEISSTKDFELLTDNLVGYESQLTVNGSLNLGFMYKTSEVTVKQDIEEILIDDFYAFPRPPVMITINHISGFLTTLISIHLKCCEGTDNIKRRRDASEKLKEYVDLNLPDDQVIILGDFNDVIFGVPDNENPFLNFIDDEINYLFADMPLAMSNATDWSYPSWPSHIDHILISNELFDAEQETVTISFDSCDLEYFDIISDHRPVMIKLSK